MSSQHAFLYGVRSEVNGWGQSTEIWWPSESVLSGPSLAGKFIWLEVTRTSDSLMPYLEWMMCVRCGVWSQLPKPYRRFGTGIEPCFLNLLHSTWCTKHKTRLFPEKLFIMCLPWCCWPFIDVELAPPPEKKKEEKHYVDVEEGIQFYPVGHTLSIANFLSFTPSQNTLTSTSSISHLI